MTKKFNPKDPEDACKILEINKEFTEEILRKAYLKKCLQYHPDKPGGSDEMFKEVVAAYNYLQTSRSYGKWNDVLPENAFEGILKKCIGFFSPETDLDDQFIGTSLKSILINCENISIKIFKDLNLEKSANVYKYFCKYNEVFQISPETLDKMKTIIKEKAKNHNILVLKSNINDLLNNKIYKLEIEEHDYYIPLWHKRFNLNDENKIMILNEYDLSDNIIIRDNNDVWVYQNINIIDLLQIEFFEIKLGDENIKIESTSLKVTKKPQIRVFKKRGIPYVDKNDLYNFENKSTVYVEITLV